MKKTCGFYRLLGLLSFVYVAGALVRGHYGIRVQLTIKAGRF